MTRTDLAKLSDITGGQSNLWTMTKSGSSQTLTNNTLTQVTFDAGGIDGGGSVIDLANDRFTAPATGLYLVLVSWTWEGTAPAHDAHISVKVGSTESIPLVRITDTVGAVAASKGINGTGPLSLASGDFVTMWINPGAVTGATARGNASLHLRTAFTLVRVT